jgi:AcrR family transcriptional regulator
MSDAERPARRADARRNYDAILATAQVVFLEHGTDASLRDVARRAEVGLGTLYRHFPTRDALLEALLREGFARLVARAEHLQQAMAPRAALSAWLREFATGAATYRGLPTSMITTLREPRSALYASCAAVRDAGAGLLARAQAEGTVRGDVTGADLFALVGALTLMSQESAVSPERGERLFSVLIDGLSSVATDSGA